MFINVKEILLDVKLNKYVVLYININNFEWVKNILIIVNELKLFVILGVSMGVIKYMGGYLIVVNLVKLFVYDLKIDVFVVFYLDYGDFDFCFKVIDVGFIFVMFDGFMFLMEENLVKIKLVVDFVKMYNVFVEVEVGVIGGEEDGIFLVGVILNVDDVLKMKEIGIDVLAVGIGNIYGKYFELWKLLDFEVLSKIVSVIDIGIVLYGGSGIFID